MTRPAPSCATEDNTRAEGFSGHEIYAQMHGGLGTRSAQAAADKAKELAGTYASIETRLKRVGETLGESWTGASADAARTAGNPISQAMIQMQDALRQADHSLSNQVYQFNFNKAQLKEMPEQKPDTGLWDTVTPWDTDAEDAANKYQGDEAHNRSVYREFQKASNTNRGELPQEFPGISADNLNIELTDTGGDNRDFDHIATKPVPHATPNFPTSTGSPEQSTGTTFTPPPGPDRDQTNTSWAGSGQDGTTGQSGLTKPGDLGHPGTGKPPIGNVIERPPNAGIPPIGVPGGPGMGGGHGMGGGRGGGGTGAGGGRFGGGSGAGAGGKFGGGMSGSGTASGTNAQPGGKAGVFGGMGGEHATAGRGAAAGAAGRGGAAGMGGMGGQGAKGEGEEDGEHKTADYLINEENTNELIGDMPMVAPPTIGG